MARIAPVLTLILTTQILEGGNAAMAKDVFGNNGAESRHRGPDILGGTFGPDPDSKGIDEETAMSNREEIAPHGDKRYIRRDEGGRIQISVEESASLSADSHHKAKADAKSGQGDRGDRHTK